MQPEETPRVNPRVTPDAKKSVCQEDHGIVHGARRQDYGTPAENHERTARLWSAYLGVPITARQVCLLNALQKVSRDAHAPKRDNLVDIAGYAENADLVGESTASMLGSVFIKSQDEDRRALRRRATGCPCAVCRALVLLTPEA